MERTCNVTSTMKAISVHIQVKYSRSMLNVKLWFCNYISILPLAFILSPEGLFTTFLPMDQ